MESARSSLLPKLKKDAKEELIEDRLKLQAAKKLEIEVTDRTFKTLLTDLATRNKMNYEQFVQHLKSTGGRTSAPWARSSGRKRPGAT